MVHSLTAAIECRVTEKRELLNLTIRQHHLCAGEISYWDDGTPGIISLNAFFLDFLLVLAQFSIVAASA
jgi:hypothetical protein